MSRNSLLLYLNVGRKLQLKLLVGALCLVISQVVESLVPLALGNLVHELTRESPSLLRVIMPFVAIGVTGILTWHIGAYLVHVVNENCFVRHFSRWYEGLFGMPYRHFVERQTGKLSGHITASATALRDLVTSLFQDIISAAISIVTTSVVLLSIHVVTGLFYLAVASVGIAVFLIAQNRALRRYVPVVDSEASMSGHIVDGIANFDTVLASRHVHHEIRTLHAHLAHQLRVVIRATRANELAWSTIAIFTGIVLRVGSVFTIAYGYTHHQLDLAAVTTLASAVLLSGKPIVIFGNNLRQLRLTLTKVNAARKYVLGGETQQRQPALSPTSAIDVRKQTRESHDVVLENVSFSYGDGVSAPVLRRVNLRVLPGERVGIVGRSGAGKSTITKLLLGFYEPTVGQVRVSRSQLSYVPQSTALFGRSIRDNIAYGVDGYSQRDFADACAVTQLDEFVDELPDGYDTRVGERGVTLSGGQCQRIVIARALLRNAPMLLLDEATSALDSHSEAIIQNALETAMKGRTIISIAHRLSTLRSMDRIVVMEHGAITEEGSHSELLQRNGAYAELWARQTGGYVG